MTERFTGKVSGRNMVSNGIYGMIGKCGRYFVGEAIDKLAEYETAEDEGRLVVLPCKVGTRVYEIYQFCGCGAWEIEEHKIKLEDLDKIGKTVFITEEEAEKALKEIKKGKKINVR